MVADIDSEDMGKTCSGYMSPMEEDMDRLVQEPEVNPLDDVAKSLHDVHMFQPKCWVWEFADDARIVMDKEEIHPAFRHRLIPLYTRAQLARAKGEEYDYEY